MLKKGVKQILRNEPEAAFLFSVNLAKTEEVVRPELQSESIVAPDPRVPHVSDEETRSSHVRVRTSEGTGVEAFSRAAKKQCTEVYTGVPEIFNACVDARLAFAASATANHEGRIGNQAGNTVFISLTVYDRQMLYLWRASRFLSYFICYLLCTKRAEENQAIEGP